MVSTHKLLSHLSKRFPKRLAKQYQDKVGLMVGRLPKDISRIYLALDLEEMNLAEVATYRPDIIITHHPFVYGTRRDIKAKDLKKNALIEAIESLKIPVYSFHTNFDEGPGGMNDALAEALGLVAIKPLVGDPMARGGQLVTPMSINDFAAYAKDRFNAPYGLLINRGKPLIGSVAIVGGGGSRSHGIAQAEGYDIYISGDAPHHVRRRIVNENYNYLDLPHEIESIFLPRMEKLLLEIDGTLQIKKAALQVPPSVV